MASSQVEIVSSSPFGCVLTDHNRRDRYRRESNARAAQAAFEKNLKELVRDQLHTKISVSSGSASDENSKNCVNNIDQVQTLRRINNNQRSNANGIDGSSTMSHRKARNLDRWAARQAREMVSTIEKQSQKAEFLIEQPKTLPSSSNLNSQNNISQCENSPESQNLGASSLVQIWEARLHWSEPSPNQSSSINNNSNPATANNSMTNSGSCCNENASVLVEEPSRHPGLVDCTTTEEPLAELDMTGQNAPSSVPSISSDAGEVERVRIVDIIRRLNSDGHEHEPGNGTGDLSLRERRNSCNSEQGEHKVMFQVTSSPKIRGRQAFHDLLLQMEKERHRELDSLQARQAVSRFPQRGRIQSMLRLRFLQRGIAIQDKLQPQSTRLKTSSDANWPQQQGSAIMHLRERFSGGIEHSITTTTLSSSTKRGPIENVNTSVNISNSIAQNYLAQDSHYEGPSITEQQTNNQLITSNEQQSNNQLITTNEHQSTPPVEDSVSHTSEIHEDVHEEVDASSDVSHEGTSLDVGNFDQQDTVEATPSLNEWDENETDEEYTDDQRDFDETHYDWFSDIARPRSYWEDRRQAWYQEMVNTSSENDEIRQLLERRTVSNFLSSDFRDRMDRLMISRVQRQISREDELDEDSQERMGQLMLSFFQRHSHSASCQGEEQEVDEGQEAGEEQALQEEEEEEEDDDDDDDDDDNEEEESSTNHQFLEATDYFYQSSSSARSPSPLTSWSYENHHEFVDDSDQIPTIASHLALPSQAYNQDQQHSSATNHLSIEMQLIYDLRRHMEQLQREMFELRKSMQSCVEMQVKSHSSSKQEGHPVQGYTNNSFDRTQRRSCCICYEMPVDSFLYRCGHMCTCLKCAHELQWSSGKCPICRAPILDVVRAYMDS